MKIIKYNIQNNNYKIEKLKNYLKYYIIKKKCKNKSNKTAI